MKIIDNVLIEVRDNDIPADGHFIIPDTVNVIGPAAFARRDKLITVTIPSGVTCLGAGAFLGCTNLQSMSLPDTLTTIEHQAFRCCQNLNNLIVPQGVIAIGCYAFSDCKKLTAITIPQGVNRIEQGTFWGCNNLHSVSLSEGLTVIANHAFYQCNNLSSVIIPQGVTTIYGNAFWSCENLTTITIPQGIMALSPSALDRCDKLAIIVVDADSPKALHLVKNQLPVVLQNKVLAKEEYEKVQEIKSGVLRTTFKELLATNQVSPLTTLLSPFIQQSFFSLLPADLLQELNFYRHATYASALLKLPELNIEVSRDEQGAVNWVDYQTRFKSKFTDVLHTLLASPTTEPSKATRNDILVSNDEPQTFSVTSMPMML